MSDSVTRKACDRCHSQKLSCKRVGDEGCERCLRVRVSCNWSPSRRHRKPQQPQPQPQQPQKNQDKRHSKQPPQQSQTEQQQQAEPHQGGNQKAPEARRSPKRRRTGSDPDLVSPDAGMHLSLLLFARALPFSVPLFPLSRRLDHRPDAPLRRNSANSPSASVWGTANHPDPDPTPRCCSGYHIWCWTSRYKRVRLRPGSA